MIISFNRSEIIEYLFSSIENNTYKLAYEDYSLFIQALKKHLSSRGYDDVIFQEDMLGDNLIIEGTDILCLDISTLDNKNIELQERYDNAYGNIVISSCLRESFDEIFKDEQHSPNNKNEMNVYQGKIFCLMGKSASGKDTVYAEVRKVFDELSLQQLVMYTTRPKRVGEIDGHEYMFISDDELTSLDNAGKVIERRDYNTQYGIWSYAIIDDEQLNAEQNYVIKEETPAGYEKLVEYFGKEHVYPIYIFVEDGVRLLRALSREMSQAEPHYDEMCRRYLADLEDFAQIDEDNNVTRFVNDDLGKCSSDIIAYIKEILNTTK